MVSERMIQVFKSQRTVPKGINSFGTALAGAVPKHGGRGSPETRSGQSQGVQAAVPAPLQLNGAAVAERLV